MADEAADLVAAGPAAARLGVAAGRGARRVEASAAPFLYAAPAARPFLSARRPRAIARGEPAERCPALGVATGGAAADVAGRALASCLADLEARAAPADCGCRVLAVDDLLAAPIEAFAYAPGVSARLVGAGSGAERLLIAEEAVAPDGAGLRVVFRDAVGPVAIADLAQDGRARLGMIGGAIYEGRREAVGWRRGRLAERLLLEGPGGARLIALIGFEPDDVAASGDLLRWPAPS